MARSKRPAVEEVEYEKQPWNIYSMMLLLALIAILIGCLFLVQELKAYGWQLDAKVSADHLGGVARAAIGRFVGDASV